METNTIRALFSFLILHVTFVPINQLTDEAKVVERLFLTRTHCGRIASLILLQQQQQIKLNVVGLSSPFFIQENILICYKKKKHRFSK